MVWEYVHTFQECTKGVHPTKINQSILETMRQARDNHEMATATAATHSFSVSEDPMCISEYGHLTCDKRARWCKTWKINHYMK